MDEEGLAGTAEATLPLILPHELLGALFRQGSDVWRRSVLGAPGSLEAFWQHALAHYSWTQDHPLHEHFATATCIPIAVYGDGARVTKEDSLLAITWNSVISKGMESKMLICACPMTWLLETSVDDIMQVVAWSLACMSDGVYPATDHHGEPWGPGSERFFRKGMPIAPGYRCVLAELRGDWEWLAKALHVPSASNTQPCLRCLCTQSGPLTWTNVSEDAPWRATVRSTADFLTSQRRSPLTHLPFSTDMVRFDVMHTVCLGVCLWVNAAALLFLCRAGVFEGGSLSKQLKQAWLSFKSWLHDNELESSQRVWTPRRLLVHNGWKEYAEVQAKAWNSRLTTNWLDQVARRLILEPDDVRGQLVLALIWSLNQSFHISEAAPRFFSQGEANDYAAAIEQAVHCYKALAVQAHADEEMLYPLRPKIHIWQEVAAVARRDLANPRFYHCFSDEDYLRLVLRAARASPRGAMAAAVVRRWLLRKALVFARRGRWRHAKRRLRVRPRPFRQPAARL